MQASTWMMFLGVSLFMAFSPGPGVLLAISNSLTLGPHRAMFSSLGNAIGIFIVSGTTMVGLGVLLQASETAFMLLKIAGAAYLIYLGVKQWRKSSRLFDAALPAQDAETDIAAGNPGHPRARLFGQGLTVALTNPKNILFFSALFPQFLQPGAPVTGQFFILTATFAACTVFAHAAYVLLANTLRRYFIQPRRVRLFNRISGGLFILLGLGLLKLRAKAAQ